MPASQSRSRPVFGYDGATYLTRRGNVWQYRRRVPASLAARLAKPEIRITVRTRDRIEAQTVAAQISASLEAEWQRLLTGTTSETAATNFERVLADAQALGVTYLPANEIATSRLEDLLARIERVALPVPAVTGAHSAEPDPRVVRAVLGGAGKPELKLSNLAETYQKLAADQAIGKSERQIVRWRATQERAIETLIARIGDKRLVDITRDDALDFRDWWISRIKTQGYNKNSANRNFGCLSAMMRTVNDAYRLNLALPFKGVRVAGDKHARRLAYDPEFVRQHFLAAPQIGALNLEASAIVRMVALTGMRPSEIVTLEAHRIRLDDDVPHLQVRPDARQLKTGASERDMPLVGLAFEIMRNYRDGFPRYRASADAFSAIANKCLTSAGLRPDKGLTVYSLRHTFKDRLIALGVPDRIQDELMGHTLRGMPYGNGSTLKHRAEWMAKIWT